MLSFFVVLFLFCDLIPPLTMFLDSLCLGFLVFVFWRGNLCHFPLKNVHLGTCSRLRFFCLSVVIVAVFLVVVVVVFYVFVGLVIQYFLVVVIVVMYSYCFSFFVLADFPCFQNSSYCPFGFVFFLAKFFLFLSLFLFLHFLFIPFLFLQFFFFCGGGGAISCGSDFWGVGIVLCQVVLMFLILLFFGVFFVFFCSC